MPSGSSAALALAAAPAPLPPPPPPPPLPPPASGPELEGDGLLLREHLAALGLDDPGPAEPAPARRAAAAQGPARRAAGPSQEERTPPGRPGAPETAELEPEEDEEGEEAELDGDLLEEEELEEAEEEEDRPSLLLLSPPAAAASQTQPLPGGSLGSVLLPAAGFDAREAAAAAAAGVLYGGDDAPGMMAAMLSHAYGPGGCGAAAGLNGEQAALLRRKSVNTTECVPVPSSEHVAEIVGRQGECGDRGLEPGMAPGVGAASKETRWGPRRRTWRGPPSAPRRGLGGAEGRRGETGHPSEARRESRSSCGCGVSKRCPVSPASQSGGAHGPRAELVEPRAGVAPEPSASWEKRSGRWCLRRRARKAPRGPVRSPPGL